MLTNRNMSFSIYLIFLFFSYMDVLQTEGKLFRDFTGAGTLCLKPILFKQKRSSY